ncbi:MAG: bifunctional adenosylcobinamide kinase/adenosylcobinamide-phosphate guanylyltransferase [Lachnospiraceae bacterium]
MKIYITGGCKNGKSYYAQRAAKAQAQTRALYYIATMQPYDADDVQCIRRHWAARAGWGFTTIEQPLHILEIMERCEPSSSLLLDSVTALLANEMFRQEQFYEEAGRQVARELHTLTAQFENIVMVSDYIFSDAGRYTHKTELYRRALAGIDAEMARCCDIVLEVVSSNIVYHKGEKLAEQVRIKESL